MNASTTTRRLASPLSLLVLLVCCSDGDGPQPDEDATTTRDYETSEEPEGPRLTPRFSDEVEAFFRKPWPLDTRLGETGFVELSDFPRSNNGLLYDYVQYYEETISGFSTMPVVYIPFEEALVDPVLPTPLETLSATAPVRLIELSSDHCGDAVPVELVWRSASGDYFDSEVLVASPVPGFALRPRASYGLIVQTDFATGTYTGVSQSAEVASALRGEAPTETMNTAFGLLSDCLEQLEQDAESVATATVFTTQDPVSEMHVLRDAAWAVADSPEITNWEVAERHTVEGRYRTFTGAARMPIYQTGTAPYNEAGGFTYEDAVPAVQRWEEVPIALTVPDGPGPYPVFIWNSGAGASLRGYVRQPFLAAVVDSGIAVAKFVPQFEDERTVPGADLDLHTYNFLNPESARAVLRQQAIDTSTFIRVVRESLPQQEGVPALDTDVITMGGHSQGAEVSLMVAAVEPEVRTFMVTGVGVYVSETIVHRTDPFDVPELLATMFDVHDEIDRFHPLIQLVQLGADVVDPGNYLRQWEGTESTPGASALIINGYNDQDVFFTSMDALTIGADLAPIEPQGWDPDPNGVWGDQQQSLPISGNRESLNGEPITRVALNSAEHDHYTVWEYEPARDLAVHVVESGFSGRPEAATEALRTAD